MPHGTPDEWLFEDWTLITSALRETKHETCTCYECDTVDSLLEDIAHYSLYCNPSEISIA